MSAPDSSPCPGCPGRPARWAIWLTRHALAWPTRLLFRPSLRGAEHLPTDRPFLLVANHSAGMAVAELASFAVVYLSRFEPEERPLAGFAHRVMFWFWPTAALLRAMGAVPSSYQGAREALASGAALLVFPGGDHESLRPVWQAHRVDFGGRRGFLRIAREAGAPVVPMGIRGSHYTAPMLWRGRWLAWALVLPRLLGFKRWGVSLLGLVVALVFGLLLPLDWPVRLALAWLWLALPLQFAPIVPWPIRFRIGPPLLPQDLFVEGDEALHLALARVEGAVQRLVRA